MIGLTCGDATAAFALDSAPSSFIVRGHEIMGQWMGSNGRPCSGMTMWPVVGMVSASGKFTHNGNTYQPGKHGYLRGRELELAFHGERRISFSHEHKPAEVAGVYPFANFVTVTHELSDDTLTTTLSAINKDHEPMRLGAGLHPAFEWGADANGDHGDSRITFTEALPENTKIYRTVDGRVKESVREDDAFEGGRVLRLKSSDFEKDAFFVVLPEEHRGKEIKLVFSCPHNTFDLEVTMEGWDGFGIWSKPGVASTFLCIEALTGIVPTDLAQGDVPRLEDIIGLRTLHPTWTFYATMNVRPVFKAALP